MQFPLKKIDNFNALFYNGNCSDFMNYVENWQQLKVNFLEAWFSDAIHTCMWSVCAITQCHHHHHHQHKNKNPPNPCVISEQRMKICQWKVMRTAHGVMSNECWDAWHTCIFSANWLLYILIFNSGSIRLRWKCSDMIHIICALV